MPRPNNTAAAAGRSLLLAHHAEGDDQAAVADRGRRPRGGRGGHGKGRALVLVGSLPLDGTASACASPRPCGLALLATSSMQAPCLSGYSPSSVASSLR